MKNAFLALALFGLTLSACGNAKAPDTAVTGAPALAQPAATAPPAGPAPTTAAVEQAAAGNQETISADTAADRSDATLERMAALPESAQLPGGKWKAGVNYKPIVPAQSTSAEAGQVEVLEVFWYGCGHCYALDPFLESWKKNKAAYIKFVRVPVMWGPAHRSHAKLYYTLEALGKLDALHTKVFDEIHQRGNMLVAADDAKSLQLQLAFAKANGISEADYTREYNGFSVNTKLQRAEELTRRFRVEGVPVIIVNGKYQTDVGMAGGNSELLQLVNDLAASDKRR
ncbi:MAG: thiol:disulfide interchange protein DsbA/DsbL [Pseudomonadota bacterium]